MTKRQKIQKTPKTPVELQALNDMLYEKLNKLEDKYVNLDNENKQLIERIRKMRVDWGVEVRKLEEKNKCLREQAEEQEFSITVLNEGLEELNTKISKLKKDLNDKDEEVQELENQNSQLNLDNLTQKRKIGALEEKASLSYTSSQVEREVEQEKSKFEKQVASQIEDFSKEVEKYKNKTQKSDSKINELQSELNRYQNILTSLFSMVTSHSNYHGQTTHNFQNRHLPNQKLNCQFDISKNDRIYDHFLSLVAPEAKIRIQKIADTGEFETYRQGQFCTVNTVIFGQTLDMDARKSPQGLLLSFSKHNPARIHKNSYGQINHLSALNKL